jgi:hypothetical protein
MRAGTIASSAVAPCCWRTPDCRVLSEKWEPAAVVSVLFEIADSAAVCAIASDQNACAQTALWSVFSSIMFIFIFGGEKF